MKYTQKQLLELVKTHVPPRYWDDATIMAVELSVKLGQEFKNEQFYKIEDKLSKTAEYQNTTGTTRSRNVAKPSVRALGELIK